MNKIDQRGFMNFTSFLKRYVLVLIFFIFIAITFVANFHILGEQQYWHLADSFLHGKLYFLGQVGTWEDAVYYRGHDYWPEGPFPAILLMPIVLLKSLIGITIPQGVINLAIVFFVFLLCYKLARKYSYSQAHALILAFAFCFASVYQLIALIPWCWYFLQNVTVLFVLLSLIEYFGKKRYWVIGLLFAGIFASRFSAGLGILFFSVTIFSSQMTIKQKIKQTSFLLTPVIVCGILLLAYNQVRFNNIFDNGFLNANNHLLTLNQRYEQLHYGLFQLRNIPTNIYYYFIKSVDAITLNFQSMWGRSYVLVPPYVRVKYPGVSFFVISPIFLYLFRASFKKKLNKLLLIPIISILALLLTYYWPGWRQVGPRYLLDLLPFVYLLLLDSFRGSKLTPVSMVIIFVSAFIDLYLLSTIMFS